MNNYFGVKKPGALSLLRISAYIFIGSIGLSGCNPAQSNISSQSNTLNGVVLEGAQPIAGSTVSLYASSNSTPVLLGKASSGADGKYTLSYSSTALGSEVYVVAAGGSVNGTENANINLVNVLGQTESLPNFVTLNETTTVASYQAFSHDWNIETNTPEMIAPLDAASLNMAFATYKNLVNNTTGNLAEMSPVTSFVGEQLAAQANVLALCIQNSNNCNSLKGYINAEHYTPVQNYTDTFSLAAALKTAGDYSSQYIHALPQINALLRADATDLPYPNKTTVMEGSLTIFYRSTLDAPVGMTHDPAGNLWIASANNFVTELKNNQEGTYRFQEFSGSSYGFQSPSAITSDNSGNIWVANNINNSVTEIKNDGQDSPVIFAGPQYRFSVPVGIASDPDGNIWVANGLNNTLTEIKNDADHTAVVYGGSPYNFSGLSALISDHDGNIWIAEGSGKKFVIELNKTEGYAPKTFATSYSIFKLTSDNNGNIWITDGQYEVAELNKSNGYAETLFSGYAQYGFFAPVAISSDAEGNIWVVNSGKTATIQNSVTELMKGNDGYTPRIFSASSYQFNVPNAMTIDQEGNIWVVNLVGKNVTEMTKSASYLPSIFDGTNYNFSGIQSVASDQQGNIFVANFSGQDQNSGEELEVSGNHRPLLFAGGYYQQHSYPVSIITDPEGNVWGVDPFGSIVTELKASLLNQPIAFSGMQQGLNNPFALTHDPMGNIWMVNSDSSVVEFNKQNNDQFTLFPGSKYDFDNPSAIASDQQGNIWIANTGTNSLIELQRTANGTYTSHTFAGGNYLFYEPVALTTDDDGNIWVLGYQQNTVTELINKKDHYVPLVYQGAGYAFYFPSDIMSDRFSNIWLINFGKGVSELKKEGPVAQYDGRLLLPGQYGLVNPSAFTSDQNGNVWITNGDNSLVELVSP